MGVVSKLTRYSAWQGDENAVYDAIQTVEQILNALAVGNLMEVPVGAIMEYAGSTAPDKWLICDGSTVNEVDYPELADVLTPVAGVITLPDFRGRVPVGAGTGTELTNRALLSAFGEETHLLDVTQIPAHTHSTSIRRNTTSAGSGGFKPIAWNGIVAEGTDSSPATTSTGGGLAHNNMQPSLAVNFIIRVEA